MGRRIVPETTVKQPKNRIRKLFVNDSAGAAEFETDNERTPKSRYRIVLNCRAESDDSRLKRKIEVGRI